VLQAKHDVSLIARGVQQCREDVVLLGLRARAAMLARRRSLIDDGRRRWEGRRVAFILPVAEVGGGANVVFAEAQAMRRFGVDAVILNLSAYESAFGLGYPNPPVRVTLLPSAEAIADCAAGYDAVIATTNQSVACMRRLAERVRSPRLGYYVQDFEPWFYDAGSAERERALASYTEIPNLIRVTKTEWNRDQLRRHVGVDATVVGPSCDIDLFRPRAGERSGPIRICAMIRPSTARRRPRETMDVLAEIERTYRDRVEIRLFGGHPRDEGFLELPRAFRWGHHGSLTHEQVASLLSTQDVFVDLSEFQAMGLTAMEAMATGLGVVVPERGGTGSFATDGINALVVNTSFRNDCVKAIASLVEDPGLLARLRRRALGDIVAHVPEQAASNLLAAMFGDGPASSRPAR
jgi:glycosyltransferase involved in cell wall biosynthesis